MPLSRMIPVFQKMFNIISSEEFCFLYVEPEKDGYGKVNWFLLLDIGNQLDFWELTSHLKKRDAFQKKDT